MNKNEMRDIILSDTVIIVKDVKDEYKVLGSFTCNIYFSYNSLKPYDDFNLNIYFDIYIHEF